MKKSNIVAILIIVGLILSVALVGVDSYFANNPEIKVGDVSVNKFLHQDTLENSTKIFKLSSNELNFTSTNSSEDDYTDDESQDNQTESNIPTVYLNLNQTTGDVVIDFAESDDVYLINSTNENASVSHTIGNNTVNIKADTYSGDTKVILSNKYAYYINGEMIAGGLATNVSDKANIKGLTYNIVTGGIAINYAGGTLSAANLSVNTGGLTISGNPVSNSHIESRIVMGGVNMDIDSPISQIRSNIRLGGVNAGSDYQTSSSNGYDLVKGSYYDSSPVKLSVNNTITLGGVNVS